MSAGAATTVGQVSTTFSDIGGLLRRGDLTLAIGVVAILVVLILPLPSVLLDLFLAVSMILSVLILMTALFIEAPLEFSAFPTVLLVATMLRLALDLAATRLILAHGHEGTSAAGHMIQAFGSFVMQGNYIIGIIVFSILVIVNFVVITKGSGRIAEVAARFTLDAMPGKQMAIDADLSAGVINDAEARRRRKELEDESAFYGAMDGASKFVRGDAIAGILIIFINIVGGIIIGVAQMGVSLARAGQSYTLLTVGEGLVSQIPALIVSTAAGLLVSKAGVRGAADKALIKQLSHYPKALGMSSFIMAIMALLPGMPTLPFLALAAGAGTIAWRTDRSQKAKAAAEASKATAAAVAPPADPPISEALKLDPLKIELGFGLVSLINKNDGSDRLTDQIKALRRQLAGELGIILPSVRLLDDVRLGANEYVIRIKEVEAGRGTIHARQLMVMDPTGGQITMPGIHTVEPTFGLPATWIDASLRAEAEHKGYTIVDPATVMSTHLTEVIKANVADLLTYADVQKLLSELPADERKLIEDIVPSQISVSGIERVLQRLLAERISVRDLPTIIEGIAEALAFTKTASGIAEHVRTRLARQLCASNSAAGGYLPLIALSPQWEQAFADAMVGTGEDRQLAMAPSKLGEFVNKVRETFEHAARLGENPVLLTSPAIRPFVRSIVERFRAHTTVMSQNEVHFRARLKTVASI
ncbi:MAG: flagellar biosynthesis protein FlhA [Bauldia sp.]